MSASTLEPCSVDEYARSFESEIAASGPLEQHTLGRCNLSISNCVPRVLSVQSSVLYGYVGNKAAVFTLQHTGLEADPLNTCQYSNHAGYDICTGSQTSADDIRKVISGLVRNRTLRQYTHLQTGYMTNDGCLRIITALAQVLKKARPGMLVVCDPVMGDDGALYVPESFVVLYKQLVVFSDVLTPNQTEMQLLTGIKLSSVMDVAAACRQLHALGPQLIVVTSVELEDRSLLEQYDNETFVTIPASFDAKYLPFRSPVELIDTEHVVERVREAVVENGQVQLPIAKQPISILVSDSRSGSMYYINVPKYDMYVSGTGDLTSAVLLAYLQKDIGLRAAVEQTFSAVQSVLRATLVMRRYELALIHARAELNEPSIQVKSKDITTL